MPERRTERKTFRVPRDLKETAEINAFRTGTLTDYFLRGHLVMQQLVALTPPFNTSRDMIRMKGHLRPMPPLFRFPTTSSATIYSNINMNLTPQTSAEITALTRHLDIPTQSAYAIAALNLLNGLVSLRDELAPNETLQFTIARPRRSEPNPPQSIVIL